MYQELGKLILENVGGKENISNVTHCATRLRFNLKECKKVDVDKIKVAKGVIGIADSNGQFQVIIGSEVSKVYKEIIKIIGTIETEGNSSEKKRGLVGFFEVISGIFTPIIPPLTAAGMLKAVLVLATTFGWLNKDSQTFYIFNFVADAAFFFFPVVLGYTAAIKFKCNPYMGMLVGGALIHPNYLALVNAKEAVYFLGMPLRLVNYASSVVPIIVIVYVMSFVEEFADRVSPKFIKFFSKPLLTVLIMTPLAFLLLGPMGSIAGEGLALGVEKINGFAPWLIPVIVGGTSPLLVMIGMHYGLIPIGFNELAVNGFDTVVGPGMLVSNIAHGGATLAVALKTKNTDLKQLAGSAGFTACLGITEPAMYGVTMKLKKPLIAVMLGGGLAGLYCGVMGVVRFSTGIPGLASLPVFLSETRPMNIVHAAIAAVIAFSTAFISMFIIGFEDIPNENCESVEEIKENEIKIKKEMPVDGVIQVKSIAKGEVIELSSVKDDAFASESLGKGYAIVPEIGEISSPIDGVVSSIFATKHAIGLEGEDGTEILIHVGIDTVRLNGEHFESCVKEGDTVKAGDILVKFDRDTVMKKGFDISTPVIVTNSSDYTEVVVSKFGKVNVGENVLALA